MTAVGPVDGDSLTAERGDRVVDGIYRALPDPVDDMLLTLMMSMTAEVWTLRDRLRILESGLTERGIPIAELIDEARNTEAYRTAMTADRDQFVSRVFAALVPVVPDTSR